MSEIGKRNPNCGIETAGLKTSGTVRYNFGPALLAEEAIRRGEARLTAHGALVADTGKFEASMSSFTINAERLKQVHEKAHPRP